jgi:hypothetical protein
VLTRVHAQAALAQLVGLGVTRVISLGAPPAPVRLAPHDTLSVHLVDDEEADLLGQLPACVAFAARAASEGAALLIACHAGARALAASILAAWR